MQLLKALLLYFLALSAILLVVNGLLSSILRTPINLPSVFSVALGFTVGRAWFLYRQLGTPKTDS